MFKSTILCRNPFLAAGLKSKGFKRLIRTTATIPVTSSNLLSVRKGNSVAIIADGQIVQTGAEVLEEDRNVRRIGVDKNILCGFIGSTPEASSLQSKIAEFIEENPENLRQACVDFAYEWRSDKFLRRCEAHIVVADKDVSLLLTDMGHSVFEPSSEVIGIGGAGNYVYSVATDLIDSENDAEQIARKALEYCAENTEYVDKNVVLDKINF